MKNKLPWLAVGLVIGIIVILVVRASYNPAPVVPSSKLTITTSFYPLYFFTSQIVGDKAEVYNITPAGAEPHDYEPTTQDMARIETSRLLILNGKLEPWGADVTANLENKNVSILTISDGLTLEDSTDEDGAIAKDPHIWLNPVIAKQLVQKILDAVIAIDPANTALFRSQASALNEKLSGLDNAYRSGLARCTQKNMVTAHTAFGYMTREYGLTQIGITGISPDDAPSPKELAEVAEFAKKNSIRYIFFESLVSPKLAETIANEVGAKTLVLNPIEGLSDEEIAAGKNYFTEMQQNLVNLKIALQCR